MIVSIGLFAILAVVFGQIFVNYGVPLTDNYNTTFRALSNMSGINKAVESQKTDVLTESGNTQSNPVGQALDLLGYWFNRGYSALKATVTVTSLFTTITDAGLNSLSQFIGIAVEPLKFIITACVVVSIAIGIILSTLVKREV